MDNLTVLAAFLAGLFSFLSPCVLPIIPGYISLITGVSSKQLVNNDNKRDMKIVTIINTLFFILGFTIIFILLQVVFKSLVFLINPKILNILLGSIIIILGLHTMEVIKIKFLYYQKKLKVVNKKTGKISAFLLGIVFGFAWTPCIGPILAGILALAAAQETLLKGVFLLLVYSIGLGIPFLLTGLFMEIFLEFFSRFKKRLVMVNIFSGILLIVIGIYIITGNFNKLFSWLS